MTIVDGLGTIHIHHWKLNKLDVLKMWLLGPQTVITTVDVLFVILVLLVSLTKVTILYIAVFTPVTSWFSYCLHLVDFIRFTVILLCSNIAGYPSWRQQWRCSALSFSHCWWCWTTHHPQSGSPKVGTTDMTDISWHIPLSNVWFCCGCMLCETAIDMHLYVSSSLYLKTL